MAVTDAHPESELLTAFAEQSLGQSERSIILDHLAGCAECRQILELALPVSETESVTTFGPARPGWVRWPALRWGLATAVIVTLVVGVREYEHRHGQYDLASKFSPHGQIAAKQGPATYLEQSEAAAASQQPAPKSAVANRNSVTHSQRAPVEGGLYSATTASSMEGMQSKTEDAATAQNRAPDQFIQNQAAASQYESYTSSDVVKAKPAVPEQASGDSAPAFGTPNMPLQTAPSLVQQASPRWTITAAGGLQRSFDAGKTWEEVNVNPEGGQAQTKLVFRAVAAIGPEVWVGGSGAILYHSSDSGSLWQQVFPLATGATPAGDITEIEFSNPQEGKIATSSGQIWTTSDNGQTWHKRP